MEPANAPATTPGEPEKAAEGKMSKKCVFAGYQLLFLTFLRSAMKAKLKEEQKAKEKAEKVCSIVCLPRLNLVGCRQEAKKKAAEEEKAKAAAASGKPAAAAKSAEDDEGDLDPAVRRSLGLAVSNNHLAGLL